MQIDKEQLNETVIRIEAIFLKLENTYKKDKLEFFNQVILHTLGYPPKNIELTKEKVKEHSLIYLADPIKEKIVKVKVIEINRLYEQAINKIDFNYPNFHNFLTLLQKVRYETKKKYLDTKDKRYDTVQFLIKMFLNLVYGAINNPLSILRTSMVKPRDFVIQESNRIVLGVLNILIENRIPIFSVETDEIFCGGFDDEIEFRIKLFLEENNLFGMVQNLGDMIFIKKKKWIQLNQYSSKGFINADERLLNTVLEDNLIFKK